MKVFDKDGVELKVGSRVRLDKRIPGHRMIVGEAVVLTADLSNQEPHVGVGELGSWFTTRPAQSTDDPYVFRCPDLLAQPENREGSR